MSLGAKECQCGQTNIRRGQKGFVRERDLEASSFRDPPAIHNLDDEDKRDTVKNHISKLTNFVLFAQTLISNMLFWSKISQCEID